MITPISSSKLSRLFIQAFIIAALNTIQLSAMDNSPSRNTETLAQHVPATSLDIFKILCIQKILPLDVVKVISITSCFIEDFLRVFDASKKSIKSLLIPIKNLNQFGPDLSALLLNSYLANAGTSICSFKNFSNNTSFHIACEQGDLDCINIIIHAAEKNDKAWQIISQQNLAGESGWHTAATHGNVCVLDCILQKATIDLAKGKETIFMSTSFGNTALHCAMANEFINVIDMLILAAKKYDLVDEFLSKQNNIGETVLHLAALNNSTEIVKIFVAAAGERVAKIAAIKNQQKETALDVAKLYGNKAVILILEKYEGNKTAF
jgi:ankyrin repeat protein